MRHYAVLAPVQIQAYNAATHKLYSDVPLEIIPDGVASTSQPTAMRQTGDEGDSPKSPGGTPSRGRCYSLLTYLMSNSICLLKISYVYSERGWSLWSIVRGGWKAVEPYLDSPTQGMILNILR